ncbi:protein PYRICULARIA ORYZAE RESISTANCE 21-like [Miscanthus floridulus]|uniref:protein PYRICULARIA ORYZAE RESISTANCE 21-like n=1 Tax=Miscanthus floridulus TaxID=154761 RepID=UPI003459541D
MAEKISMLIVVVDLDCHKCYHKIRKILCQLQDHERIRTISFDTESKTIAIVGPFDPHRLACKLRCKGGKVVRDVHIVDTTNGGGGKPPPENMPDAPPAPAPMRNGKKKNKNKEKAPPPAPPPPPERPPSPPPPEPAPGPPPETMMPPPSSPVHHPRPPDTGMSAMVPQPHYVEEKPPRTELEPPMSPPPKEMPPMKESPPPLMMPACPGRPLEQPVDEYVIPTVEIPSWPAPPVGPCGCPCCAPCYQGYYDSCRCGCCGRVYGTTVRPLPAPCGRYRGCRTFSDDDPSATCSVM